MAFVCCQLLQEVRPAPPAPLQLAAGCIVPVGVRRLHWVMIPNQNNYNNCLCEENQIKEALEPLAETTLLGCSPWGAGKVKDAASCAPA